MMKREITESFSFEETLGAHLLQFLLKAEMAMRLDEIS